MFERILVPIDGSAPAMKAVTMALEVATRFRAAVRLVFVVDDSIHVLAEPSYVQPDYTYFADKMREEGEALLADAARRFKDSGVTVTTELRSGYVPAELASAAKQFDATMIVMGTHGRTGWERVVLGSVASGVLASTTVPLLLVRP